MSSGNIAGSIVQQYEAASAQWYDKIYPYASKLFFTLVAIELTWAAIRWVIEHDDPVHVVMSLFRHIVATALFYALLIHPEWFDAVISGFKAVGEAVSGKELDPVKVVEHGWGIVREMATASIKGGFTEKLLGALVVGVRAAIVMVAYAMIAAQLLITIIESKIVIGAGSLLIAFAGSSWTKSFTERYLSYTVAVGIKLFLIYIVIGLGEQLSSNWAEMITEEAMQDTMPLFSVAVAALIYGFIAWNVPAIASSMLMGNVALSGAAFVGSTVGAAAGAATGAAVTSGLAIRSARTGADVVEKAALAASVTEGSAFRKATAAVTTALGEGSKQLAKGSIRTIGGSPDSPGQYSLKDKLRAERRLSKDLKAEKAASLTPQDAKPTQTP